MNRKRGDFSYGKPKTGVWVFINALFLVLLALLCVYIHFGWEAHVNNLKEEAAAAEDASSQFGLSLGAGLTEVIGTFYDILVTGVFAFEGLFILIGTIVVAANGKRYGVVRGWSLTSAIMKIFALLTSVLGALFAPTPLMMALCAVMAALCLAGTIYDFIFRSRLEA